MSEYKELKARLLSKEAGSPNSGDWMLKTNPDGESAVNAINSLEKEITELKESLEANQPIMHFSVEENKQDPFYKHLLFRLTVVKPKILWTRLQISEEQCYDKDYLIECTSELAASNLIGLLHEDIRQLAAKSVLECLIKN